MKETYKKMNELELLPRDDFNWRCFFLEHCRRCKSELIRQFINNIYNPKEK